MRILLAGFAGVAVIGGFWFGLIAPKRADSAKVQDQISQAQARRDAAVAAAASADQARLSYEHDYATVARLGKAVPADDDVASLLYQVESVARANRIDFRSAKLTAGAAPVVDAKPAADASTAGAGKGKSADPTAPSQQPQTAVAPVIGQAPPGAVVGSAGLLTLPFAFSFDGGYLHMQRMLGAIDRLADATGGRISVRGRLLTVDGFSLTASRFGFPKVKAQVSATAYIAPAAAGVPGAPAVPGTAAAATPPAAGSPAGGALAPPTATASIQPVGR
jgi:hypothetical protein